MLLELRTESPKVVRNNKMVPGVVYGKDFGPISVKIDEKELKKSYQLHGQTLPFTATLDGKQEQVYIKDVQFDLFKHNEIIHFDLMRITTDTVISADILINIIGREEIEKQGYFVETTMPAIAAEYTVANAISHINVDITDFKLGDSVFVKDLNIPEGITVLADEDNLVLTVKEPTIVVLDDEDSETDTEQDVETDEETSEEQVD